MASILDKFVIQVGVDGKGVKKGIKETSKDLDALQKHGDEAAKSFAASGDAMAKGFSKARNEALALMAVFTGGRSLKAFTSEVTRANNSLANTSRRLGVNPQSLAQAQNMVKGTGGDPSEVAGLISSLQQRMMDPQQRANLNRAFGQIHMQNWDSLLSDPTAFMKAMNRGIQNTPLKQRNRILNDIGVGDGEANVVTRTTKAFDGLADSYKGLGPTNEQLAHSQQLFEDWQHLTTQSEALGRALLDDVSPGLKMIIDEFSELEKGHVDWINALGATAVAMIGLGSAIKGVLALKGVANVLSGLKKGGLCGCGPDVPGGGKKPNALEPSGERGKPGRVPQKSARVDEIRNPKVSEGTLKYLGEREAKSVVARVMERGAVRWGLKAIPIVGEVAMALDSPSLNVGEGDAVDRLRKQGAFGKFGFSMGPYEQYARAVAKIEGARYDQMGGFHNAYAGKYQMSRDAITDAAHWLKESAPSTAQFLKDPAMQERYFRAHTDQNFKYLMGHSGYFRSANEMQRLAILGYAHNQGAGAAARWLQTGNAGRDGFGTSGTAYSDAISKSLNAYNNDAYVKPGSQAVQVHGDIVIHTQAKDAQGIARDIHSALSTPSQISHGNARGLQ